VSINGLNVWDEFGENEIENGFGNRLLRTKEKSEFCTCQSSTTVRPCGTAIRVFSTLGGMTVHPVGTTVPTSQCTETPFFHFFKGILSIPMDPKHLNLIK
jgi:hypothetical protein